MQQIPTGEAHTSSSIQQSSFVVWNSNVSCRLHKSQAIVRILRQINLVYAIPSDFLNVRFNIIIPRSLVLLSDSSASWFSHTNSLCTWPVPPSHARYIPHKVLLLIYHYTWRHIPYNSDCHLMKYIKFTLCVSVWMFYVNLICGAMLMCLKDEVTYTIEMGHLITKSLFEQYISSWNI